MSTMEKMLKKKIEALERQNALLKQQRHQNTDLDNFLQEIVQKRKRKNPPVPLMKIRKYVVDRIFLVCYYM